MKQPIKKKEFTRPSIASIKEKLNLTIKSEADLVKSVADKPIDFIPLPEAFSDAVISKELTASLYCLSRKGFYFSDYYQLTEYYYLVFEICMIISFSSVRLLISTSRG